VIDTTSIARENVAVGATPTATPVAAAAGVLAVTVGAEAVVKLQEKTEASATPSAAFTDVLRLAVYVVPAARPLEGVRVAVFVELL
jgi:hypothetical protein